MAQITVEKRNHLGQLMTEYHGEIIERGPNWVCLRAVFQRDDTNLGFVTFRKGDVFIEWFYDDRWYNVFQVHEGDSLRVRGWYCNVTRPAVITESRIVADDLALDVFVMPNGNIVLMDEDEFDALNLPTGERMKALYAIQSIRRGVSEGKAPFNLSPRG